MNTPQRALLLDSLTLTDVPETAGFHHYRVQCLEMADGSSLSIPAVVVRGASSGPTMYLGSAIHGDEIGGVHVVQEVLSRLDPSMISGNLLVVPVQNPLAFQQQHRLPLPLLIKSPMDQFPGDPWMSFADYGNGNSASLVASCLTDLIRQCDAAIDLHTPTTGGKYVQFAFLPPERSGSAYGAARALADAFAPEVILAENDGVYVLPGTLHVTATEWGIPAFGVEFGEGGRRDLDGISSTADGVLRAMKSLGMIPEAPAAERMSAVIERMTPLRTSRAGLLSTNCTLGEIVETGQPLATIHDVFGNVVETLYAPHNGIFMRETTFQVVNQGERVIQVALANREEA